MSGTVRGKMLRKGYRWASGNCLVTSSSTNNRRLDQRPSVGRDVGPHHHVYDHTRPLNCTPCSSDRSHRRTILTVPNGTTTSMLLVQGVFAKRIFSSPNIEGDDGGYSQPHNRGRLPPKWVKKALDQIDDLLRLFKLGEGGPASPTRRLGRRRLSQEGANFRCPRESLCCG